MKHMRKPPNAYVSREGKVMVTTLSLLMCVRVLLP